MGVTQEIYEERAAQMLNPALVEIFNWPDQQVVASTPDTSGKNHYIIPHTRSTRLLIF